MAGYINLLFITAIAAVTFCSATYFFGKLLWSRMALQDLEQWTKPHRTLTRTEKLRLMADYDALGKIDKKTGALLIPKNDNVYLLEGKIGGFGLETIAAKSQKITIDNVAVEFPNGLSEYLQPGINVAEVAISKTHAIVLSLNSVFLDPPKSENVAPEMVAALKRLQVIEKKSGLERRPNSLRSRD